jgi:hypothetical protein
VKRRAGREGGRWLACRGARGFVGQGICRAADLSSLVGVARRLEAGGRRAGRRDAARRREAGARRSGRGGPAPGGRSPFLQGILRRLAQPTRPRGDVLLSFPSALGRVGYPRGPAPHGPTCPCSFTDDRSLAPRPIRLWLRPAGPSAHANVPSRHGQISGCGVAEVRDRARRSPPTLVAGPLKPFEAPALDSSPGTPSSSLLRPATKPKNTPVYCL